MASIEDMLRALEGEESNEKMSPKEFWKRLVNGDEWNDMNFDSKEEFDQFIEDNPYDSI
jgi:hypothetical protein